MKETVLISIATASVLAFFTLLQDPLLMSVLVVALQVAMFPAMKWLTLFFVMIYIWFVYTQHDLVLSDISSFFIRTDDTIQRTVTSVAILLSIAKIARLVLAIMAFEIVTVRDVLQEYILPITLFVAKYGIEKNSDASVLQSLFSTLEYWTIAIHGTATEIGKAII